MKKPGRPPSPFKTQIHGVDEVEGKEPLPHEIDDAIETMQKAHQLAKDPKMMGHVHEATGKKIMGLKALKALAGKKRQQGL